MSSSWYVSCQRWNAGHQVDIFLVKDGILGEGSSFLCLPLHPRKLLFGMLPLFLDKIMHTHKYWLKRQPKFFLQYRLPWDSPLTWVIAAFAIDFCYYWVHRSAHGKSLLLVVLLMIVYWFYYLCITCYLFWVRRSVHGKCLVLVLLFLLVLTCALQLFQITSPQNRNINWSCILQKSMFSGPRTRSHYCLHEG